MVGASNVVGAAQVRVDFVLPAYAEEGSGPVDTVTVNLSLSEWPWQAAGDHLMFSFSAWPNFAVAEHLAIGTSPSSLLSGVSTPSGAAFEEMAAATHAVANATGPAPKNITAAPIASGTPSLGGVSVTMGSAAGEYSSLNYSATVRVLFPTSIAGIPTIDLVAVGGTATLISLLVATGARRLRRRPSDLTYVEEEVA